MSRREARSYLESLAGVDPCSAASVVLYSLGGHAVPVDDDMLKYLRKEELIDPRAEIGEVQGFLERHVPAADAQAFTTLLRRCVTSRLPRRRLTKTLRKEKSRARANKKPTREASRKTSARRKRRGASRR